MITEQKHVNTTTTIAFTKSANLCKNYSYMLVPELSFCVKMLKP